MCYGVRWLSKVGWIVLIYPRNICSWSWWNDVRISPYVSLFRVIRTTFSTNLMASDERSARLRYASNRTRRKSYRGRGRPSVAQTSSEFIVRSFIYIHSFVLLLSSSSLLLLSAPVKGDGVVASLPTRSAARFHRVKDFSSSSSFFCRPLRAKLNVL